MPRIPIPTMDTRFPVGPINPQAVGAPYGEIAQAGERMEGLGRYTTHVFDLVQRAQDHVQALKLEQSLDADLDKELSNYRMRTDYENYDTHSASTLESLREKYNAEIGDNPRLAGAFDLAFQKKSGQFVNAVRLKKVQDITNEGKYLAEVEVDRASQKYANATSPEERDLVTFEFDEKMKAFTANGILPKDFAYEKTRSFEKKGQEATLIGAAHSDNVPAMQGVLERLGKGEFNRIDEKERATYRAAIEGRIDAVTKATTKQEDDLIINATYQKLKNDWQEDYEMMGRLLRSPDFQKGNSLDIKRIEAVDKILKIEKGQVDAITKKAHDDEEMEIGNLLMKGDFNKAFAMAKDSKLLSGDEKQKWGNAVDAWSKKDEKIDPNEEAAEIIKINGMVSKGIDQKIIKDSIILSPRLSRESKKQEITKLESKLSQEIKDGRGHAYKDIQDIIVPRRGMLANLLETPLETMAVKNAQIALDQWVDTLVKLNKPPSAIEIRKKAYELAAGYQVGISKRMEYMEEEAKKTAEELKKSQGKK